MKTIPAGLNSQEEAAKESGSLKEDQQKLLSLKNKETSKESEWLQNPVKQCQTE